MEAKGLGSFIVDKSLPSRERQREFSLILSSAELKGSHFLQAHFLRAESMSLRIHSLVAVTYLKSTAPSGWENTRCKPDAVCVLGLCVSVGCGQCDIQ